MNNRNITAVVHDLYARWGGRGGAAKMGILPIMLPTFIRRVLPLLAIVASLLCGCGGAAKVVDIRSMLLASAVKGDPDFPDGNSLLLTHFSHVGQLVSSKGEVVYVADRRAVIAGMHAPRGQSYITFFDGQYRYLGKIRYVESRPLWCDGSRLYLFGDLDATDYLFGNVIDIADGFKHLKAYHMSVYGSSGGIEVTPEN